MFRSSSTTSTRRGGAEVSLARGISSVWRRGRSGAGITPGPLAPGCPLEGQARVTRSRVGGATTIALSLAQRRHLVTGRPLRLSPTDLLLRERTFRPGATPPPAAPLHGEQVTLSDNARDLVRGQGPHARGDVRWYRAARCAPSAARLAAAPSASGAPPAPLAPSGCRQARAAIQAYRAGMSLSDSATHLT